MFPDALNWFSFVIAVLCTAPLVVALYHYIGHVVNVFYCCNDTVFRIEQKLKDIEGMERSEEKAYRPPPPYLCDHIQACKINFEGLRGRTEHLTIWQSPLKLISVIYHIVRGDAVVCRLLDVERALVSLLDKWKEKADVAVMTNYGGHLPPITTAPVEIDIQAPSLPAPEVPESVPEGVSTVVVSRLAPQTEQPVQCSHADSDSDLESTSGSDAGSTSGHDSQLDTDAEILQPLPTTLPRLRSSRSHRTLRRKRSTPLATDRAEDDRAYLTMYTSNTAASLCRGDGYPGPDLVHPPRLYTGRVPPRLLLITEGLAPAHLGESCEGEDTPTALRNDIVTQSYGSMTPTTPTFFQVPTSYTPPLPPPSPARVAKLSGC